MKPIKKYLFTGKEHQPFFQFWQERLKAVEAPFLFQQAKNRPVEDMTIYRADLRLSSIQMKALSAMVGDNPTGRFIVLTSFLGYLLSRYSGREHLVFETPVYLPFLKGEAHVDTVPLLLDVRGSRTIREQLAANQSVIGTSYKFQNFPISLIHGPVQVPERFSSVLVYYNRIHRRPESGAPLLIEISEEEGVLNLSFQARSEFFDPDFLERMPGHFNEVLKGLTDLTMQGGTLDPLPEMEHGLLADFAGPSIETTGAQTVIARFLEQVGAQPQQTALIDAAGEMTAASLNEAADVLAGELVKKGIGPGQAVGLMVGRTRLLAIGILAIMKTGAVYLPVDPHYPATRRRHLMTDGNIQLLLSETQWRDECGDCQSPIIMLDELDFSVKGTSPRYEHAPNSPAYIIYTSGSTGLPKGVVVTHDGLYNMVCDQIRVFKMTSRDRVGQFASFSFDASISEIFTALCVGGGLVMLPREMIDSPPQLLAWLRSNLVTVITLPPAYASALDLNNLSFLRVLISAGEAVRASDAFTCSGFLSYFNAYGPTECSVCATIQQVEAGEPEPIPIGKPIANTRIYVMDGDLNHTPVGITGELYIAGRGVASGYVNRPALTALRFVPDPHGIGQTMYRTGDMGRWRSNGVLVYEGRNDHQVKVNGFRIETGEIENLLRSHPAVEDAVVFKEENGLAAYLTTRNEIEDMTAWLADQVPAYMVPGEIIEVGAFPLTVNGKVDAAKLAGMRLDSEKTGYLVPEGPLETRLAQIWQDVLGKEMVGRQSNFFVLGGDSMKAIRLAAEINKSFNAAAEVKDIFNFQDLQDFAKFLSRHDQSGKRNEAYEKAEAEIQAAGQRVRDQQNQPLPRSFEDAYPISDIQSGMIFHYMLEPDFPIYHCQMFQSWIDEDFNLENYNKALRHLTAAHPVLRTSFHLTGFQEPIQMVHHASSLSHREIHYEDLTHMNETAQRARLLDLVRNDRVNNFNIEEPGQWRMSLYRLKDHEYGMFWSTHHAILDGWSEALFLEEFTRIYLMLNKGQTYEPQTLAATYKHFLIDQRYRKQDPHLQAFWKKELADYERSPIPFGRSEGMHEANNQVGYYAQQLPADVNASLLELAQKHQTGVKEICLSAFMYLMHATTNADDLTVGLVCNARPELEDADRMLGCFLNTVPFRVKMEASPKVEDLIREVSERTRALKAYDKLPLTYIADLIGEKSSNKNLIYDIMFNFAEFHVLHESNNLERTEPLLQLNETATNTAMIFAISKSGPNLKVVVNYREELYRASEINYLAKLYLAVLKACLKGGELRTTRLLDDLACRELLETLNRTRGSFPRDKTIHGLFAEQAGEAPDAVALSFQGENWTYGALETMANQCAHYLKDTLNLRPNDLVGLLLDRSPQMVVCMLGVLKSGAAYVPMDPEFPEKRVSFVVEDAALKALICGEPGSSQLACPQIALSDMLRDMAQKPEDAPETSVHAMNIAYVIYTSGSTGIPKGVEIGHRSVVNFLTSMAREPGISPRDILLSVTTPTFDIFVLEMMLPLSTGAHMVMAPKAQTRDPQLLMELMEQARPTIMQATPSTWRMLVHCGWKGSPGLKLLCGGEALDVTLGGWLLERCASLWNLYGPTETTVWSTVRHVRAEEDLRDIGKPILNTRIYFVNQHGDLLPRGVPGELCISGDGLARGYKNRRELTDSKFTPLTYPREQVFKTGDLGQWLPDGNIRFLGRIDDQVKIHGHRIEPGEIDAVLLTHPSIGEVVTALKKDHRDSPCLCAYFIEDKPTTPGELRDYLQDRLPAYMIPAHFITLKEFPLTTSGKTDRKRLPAPTGDNQKDQRRIGPQTETERVLHDIWSELLGVSAIHIYDNFFTIGGHSLTAVQMLIQLQSSHGVRLPLKAIFSHPSIHTLALEIDGLRKVQKGAPSTSLVVPLNSDGGQTPMYMIPPVLGSPAVFLSLAERLEQDYHCLGLQCKGLHGNRSFDASIEAMAATFAQTISERKPLGEIRLLGYSMGASVAFEVAYRLESKGFHTSLVLLDGSVGGRGANVQSCYDQEVEAQIQKWSQHLGQPAWLERMVRHNLTIFDGHRIRHKIQGKILALEAEHQVSEIISHPNPGMAGWGRQTSGPFVHHFIKGGHHEVLDEEQLPILTEHIQTHL